MTVQVFFLCFSEKDPHLNAVENSNNLLLFSRLILF